MIFALAPHHRFWLLLPISWHAWKEFHISAWIRLSADPWRARTTPKYLGQSWASSLVLQWSNEQSISPQVLHSKVPQFKIDHLSILNTPPILWASLALRPLKGHWIAAPDCPPKTTPTMPAALSSLLQSHYEVHPQDPQASNLGLGVKVSCQIVNWPFSTHHKRPTKDIFNLDTGSAYGWARHAPRFRKRRPYARPPSGYHASPVLPFAPLRKPFAAMTWFRGTRFAILAPLTQINFTHLCHDFRTFFNDWVSISDKF